MSESSLTLADIERTFGSLTADDREWLLGRLSVTAPAEVAEALKALAQRRGLGGLLLRVEKARCAAGAPTTTAEILREAARIARSQAPTVLGVAQTIRLAAGADDPAARARAEAALLFIDHHVEPGLRVEDLERWRDRRTCRQVVEALELAAAAAEQGGAR